MNGDLLANKVRRIIRDFNTSTRSGLFWSDNEIRLALNIAQDSFVNFCIDNNLFYYFRKLIRQYEADTSLAPSSLPDNFMAYSSALVYDNAEKVPPSKLAQIHVGGDADKYRWISHDGCFIINQDIAFTSNGVGTCGVLFYYKYPSFIGLTSLNDHINRSDFSVVDFDQFIYDNIISYHASVILGMKETKNKRNVLIDRHLLESLINVTDYTENHQVDADIPKQKYSNLMKAMRQAGVQNG